MNVLVTGSRLPFALEMIRKLGRAGHVVVAADTFRAAPGSHSRHVAASFVVTPPTRDSRRFAADVEAIVRTHPIDLVVPAFEEVFCLARHREELERFTRLLAPSFETLRTLHDKLRFVELAQGLGLRVPETLVARDRDELRRACARFPRFFARPAYTRGGVTLYTNSGPLAGALTLEECEPTRPNPFLVQRFVDGIDLCTYSIAHGGRVAAHVSYVHPLTLEHAGGIVFESVVVPETLEVTRRIVEATGYEGQISLDFIDTDEGLVLSECNPRASAGLMLLPDSVLSDALLDRHPERALIGPAGVRRKLSLALLRNIIVRREEARENLRALLGDAADIYADPADLRPLLYQLLAYARVLRYRLTRRRVHRTDLMQGYFDDLCWDGGEIR